MMNGLYNINDRISYFIDYQFNGNRKKFAESIDFSPQVIFNIVSGRKSKPSYEVLEAILSSFVDLNAEWLLTGKGEMLKTSSQAKPPEGVPDVPSVPELQQMVINMQKREIDRLQEEIHRLKKEHPSPADHTKPTHSKQ